MRLPTYFIYFVGYCNRSNDWQMAVQEGHGHLLLLRYPFHHLPHRCIIVFFAGPEIWPETNFISVSSSLRWLRSLRSLHHLRSPLKRERDPHRHGGSSKIVRVPRRLREARPAQSGLHGAKASKTFRFCAKIVKI